MKLTSKMSLDESLRRKWFLPSSPKAKLALLTSEKFETAQIFKGPIVQCAHTQNNSIK